MSLAPEAPRDPLVPRPIDMPTEVPLEEGADLSVLDGAKILAAPDDPDDQLVWRAALRRWRDEARERIGYDGSAYEQPELAWTQRCFSVALVWLWDERLYDHAAQRFTPERLLADAESLGGWDGIVLWHAYPVIGIDERNQFDWYRDVPGIRELVAFIQERGIRVFVDYNPWDVGTRREPVGDAEAVGEIVRRLGADGVFLDTMKEAMPELRAALPDAAFEGESTLPLARIADHHLSWAQWFADSQVPGVIRAKWFEQRHMLHHTRRWNRDHLEELHSAWLNGVGMLVWDTVFGSWVGWNERDKEMLRAMVSVQRHYADLFALGDWQPLAGGSPATRVFASRWTDGETELWALANRGPACEGQLGATTFTIPAGGIAAVVNGECVMVAGAGDATFPARETVRVPAPVVRMDEVPDGFAEAPRRRRAARRPSAGARRAPTARPRTSRSGSRCRRGCTTSSRCRATRSRRRASRSRGSRCRMRAACRGPASRWPRRASTRRRSAPGCRPRTSGSSPPRRVCWSAAGRSCGTGRRASTPTA